jgi:sugar phosphate isomerase/epimerase
MSLPPVGAQLLVFGAKYDINTATNAILDCVAGAGYVAVEGGASDPDAYKAHLDARGLRFAAMHTGLAALRELTPLQDYLTAVGGADLCISGLLTWEGRTLQDYKDGIALLNEAGRQLRDAGVHLHYHNHDFEFAPVTGKTRGIDLLLDGLDFSAVDLCVDVAWVYRGGDDPATFLAQHNERIGYLHFKDFDGQSWIELGQGKVDFHSIMRVLPDLTGVRWVMIEQDATKLDPMESATLSRAYLRETFGY